MRRMHYIVLDLANSYFPSAIAWAGEHKTPLRYFYSIACASVCILCGLFMT